jgi:5-methylthioadenosine/S-adenosylhomocysteine deaminase
MKYLLNLRGRMPDKKAIVAKQVVTSDDNNSIYKNSVVEIDGNKIVSIKHKNEFDKESFDGIIYDFSNLTLVPGFIQTHIHLCQTLFRGLADDLPLLDWLKLKIFPMENSLNKESMRASVQLGISELLLGGTTTILDMGSLHYHEVVFEELIKSGMRAFSGKCLIDVNDLYPGFKSNTNDELKEISELAHSFHGSSNGKLKYSFSPRFALSCTEKLLRDSKEMMKDFPGSIYHTHASENKEEINEVRTKFGKENIDYLNSLNLLGKDTVLAHCIHLNESEKKQIKNTQTRIAHCSSSNLKLGSGIARIPEYLKDGISVSLGADGAPCNNNLSIFTEMRLAALIQKPIFGANAMDAQTVFRLATIEGAKALHLQDEVGSIEVGKKADLVLIDLENVYHPVSDENIYSSIVYSSSSSDVKNVMIDGELVVEDRISKIYEKNELALQSKTELVKLLKRI